MKDKDYIIIIFIVLFIVYYMTIILKDYRGLFFVIILFSIIYIQYINTNNLFPIKDNNIISKLFSRNKSNYNETKDLFLENKEKEIINDIGIEETNFYTRKPLNNLKFIKNSKQISDQLYRLRIIKKYDNELYNKIIYLTEHFLRLHYKIMMNYYEFNNFFNTIKDIRNQLLNNIKSIVFVTPKINEEIINDVCDNIQGITHRYLKILQLKYKKTQYTESAPFELDTAQSTNFNIY